MKIRNRFHLLRGELGASLVELALVTPLFMLLAFGAVDFGRACYLMIEIAGAAHAGAIYGSQYPTDTAGMKATAQNDAPDVPSLSVPTPTYGCECANGSSYSANCATTPSCSPDIEVDRVNVTVSATYKTLFPWPKVPKSLSLSSSASMRSGGS